jgi:hypothetical protein
MKIIHASGSRFSIFGIYSCNGPADSSANTNFLGSADCVNEKQFSLYHGLGIRLASGMKNLQYLIFSLDVSNARIARLLRFQIHRLVFAALS